MGNLAVVSIEVTLDCGHVFEATVQEAFALVTMPCMSALIAKMIPIYGVPPVSEPEN